MQFINVQNSLFMMHVVEEVTITFLKLSESLKVGSIHYINFNTSCLLPAILLTASITQMPV